MKSLNSMTFQGFHDLYEPFRGWGRGMTIERGVGDLKQKCPLWGVGGGYRYFLELHIVHALTTFYMYMYYPSLNKL